MRHFFYCDTAGRIGSVGLLLLRLVMGAAFVLHGWGKIQNPFSWIPPEMPVPGIWQALAALSEFGGGIALILGVLTRLASLGIVSVMVMALGMVHIHMGHPFVSQTGGSSCELAAVYLACAVLFFLQGPGRFSLDAKLFGIAPRCEPVQIGAVLGPPSCQAWAFLLCYNHYIHRKMEGMMASYVCPWWCSWFALNNPVRRWIHDPQKIVGPYVKPGMTVLETGCGVGWFEHPAAVVGETLCLDQYLGSRSRKRNHDEQ